MMALWYVNYISPFPRNVSLGRLWIDGTKNLVNMYLWQVLNIHLYMYLFILRCVYLHIITDGSKEHVLWN